MNDSTKTNPNELLVTAVNDGNLDKVKEYLENGCSLHKKEDTLKSCFLTASTNGHLELVKYLFQKGSSMNMEYNLSKSLLKSSPISICGINKGKL